MFSISSICKLHYFLSFEFYHCFLEPKLTDFSREQSLIKCFVPGVVLQLQVSQSTDQSGVVFQEHPADLPRGFQQSFKVDNYYQA